MTQEKPAIDVVLEHYGAEHVPSGRGWRAMRCPFHDDTMASASVNNDEQAFACHACGVSGDSFALIMHAERCSFPEALKHGVTVDSDWQPNADRTRRRGRRNRTGRSWRPPGRRGRAW